jgi:hypothetical protein
LKGYKIISIQKSKVGGANELKVTRDFQGDEVISTLEHLGLNLTCKHVYKKIE